MTIENQQRRIVYDVDGVSLAYPVPFPFLEPEWLTVSVGTGEIGTTDTTLVDGVDYEVTGAGDPAGGVVILATPQPDGMKLAISRWVPLTQQEVYPEGGKFPAETTEDCFDKLTMIAQQLKDLATSNNFSPSTSTETGAHVAAWISEQTQAAEQSATEAAASADRAAALVDPASLASSVFNVRKAQVLVAGEPGQVVTLDGYYYPMRDVLYLTYNGTVLTPLKSGVSTAGAYSYEEVGADPDVASNQVRLWFATSDGDVLDIFVVASAAGRNVEEIEALVVQARESATEAAASESNAATSAEEAQEAARALPDISTANVGDTIVVQVVGGEKEAVYGAAPGDSIARADMVIAAPVAEGGTISVPQYMVGSKKLSLYLAGTLAKEGDDGMYSEVGAAGSMSTTIKVNVPLAVGWELTAFAAA